MNYRYDVLTRVILVVTGACLLAPFAYAQDAGNVTGYSLEEIVVTARKREEGLQETPLSIAAFTEQDLRFRQVESTDDLAKITPNLTFDSVSPSSGSSSAAQIFIRGIGQTDFTPVTDPGVGLYIDGIYMARSVGNVLDFVDLDRVEILRGPQGTLFGRNTIGGAIVIHTRRPTDELGGSIEARAGNDSAAYLTGKVNVPFTDNLWGNLAVDFRQRDGYVTRINDGIDTGDEDKQTVRGSLLWNATDKFKGYFTFDYTKIDENGAPTVSGGANDLATHVTFGNGLLASCTLVAINPGFPAAGPPSFPPPGPTNPGVGNDPGCIHPTRTPGPFVSEGTYGVFSELDIWGVSLELTWDVTDWLTITSLTGFREMEMESGRDADNTEANIFATVDLYDHQQISQEFHFGGTVIDDRLDWLLGFYYFQEEGHNINPVVLPAGAIQSGGFYDNESIAVFGQGTYNFTDKLALTFGARYTEDTKKYTPDQFALGDASQAVNSIYGPTWPLFAGVYLPPPPNAPMPAGTRILPMQEFEVDFDDTNIMATLAYNFTDQVMAYVSYSEGYKSGGFDQRFAAPPIDPNTLMPTNAPSTFQPETADTFEVGLKSQFFDDRVRVNLAFFTTDYEDLQLIIRETFNPITFNGGTADVNGGELELTWVPTDRWYITAALGYIDAEYSQLSDEVVNNPSPILPTNKLVNTPELTSAVGAAYTFDVGSWGTLTPRVDWFYKDEEYNDAVNTPQLLQDSYSLLDAALILESFDEHWRVILAGKNLTDETYLITGNSAFITATGYVEQVYGRDTEWWISAKYSF